jgi:hypothetical protein
MLRGVVAGLVVEVGHQGQAAVDRFLAVVVCQYVCTIMDPF